MDEGAVPDMPGPVSFSGALHRIRLGGAARRQAWDALGAPGVVCLAQKCRDETGTVEVDPFLVYAGNGRAMAWMPAVGDLLADDWILVDAPPAAAEPRSVAESPAVDAPPAS